MEIQKIIFELRKFIKDQFKVSDTDPDFNEDVHLFDYGYVDSFGAVNLIAFVEKTFSIMISEADLIVYPLNTIRDIAHFVIKRKKGEI